MVRQWFLVPRVLVRFQLGLDPRGEMVTSRDSKSRAFSLSVQVRPRVVLYKFFWLRDGTGRLAVLRMRFLWVRVPPRPKKNTLRLVG